ncbi:fungal-specific transcription factor domain-containing protein [Apiosordaria backusii]|uniref:Fungal-specific transcription factor domain-containing protein n=1 Tax=Apiosordaria backusii TaxID=314023 RepID=A0AA40BLI4_9PEZI|nr:fungal-specific transcription factor domain-containing protein [Apiosordaria backusii]
MPPQGLLRYLAMMALSYLGNALIRVALANTSASATAVLQCLLAFSALRRHDVHSQAFELKITALQALAAASATTLIGTTEAIQHVAAGMLLCSFEAHKSSCTSGEWTIYLENSVKYSIFGYIGKKSISNMGDYKNFLQILDWRIRSLTFTTPETVTDFQHGDTMLTLELYQLALLIYLSRASNDMINQSFRTEKHIARAFSILPKLRSCDRQFPVFILGCEAKNDEYRAVILDLIARTEKRDSSRSFNHVKLLLQAVWAQDDWPMVRWTIGRR